MRIIKKSAAFKRDLKREASGSNVAILNTVLPPLLIALASDAPIPARFRDHALTGIWSGYRECHAKPNLLLIYKKPDDETLRLVRLGSHAELFGM
jgi:mRNA interferase YafQ